MPGRRPPPPPRSTDEHLCRRCHAAEAGITVRNEGLCRPCFAKYVQSKVVKRMESFRVRHSDAAHERKLLLALSHDACSAALLHILSQHLQAQAGRTGRTGFKICVLLVVDDTSGDVDAHAPGELLLEALKARYPEHHYHSLPLSAAFASEHLPDHISTTLDPALTPHDRSEHLLNSPKSLTSRQDLKQIFKRRLIVQYAKDMACEAVVWPDTTTKLAEKSLAETAKGRGFSLPWIIANGVSPHGIPFYYPLRELLSKEIEAYVSFLEPPFEQHLVKPERKPSVSTKNTTIDDLMSQYFESVEQEYPSIVANVVRTTSKLHSARLREVEQQCELCSMPLEGRAPAMSRLCYGCVRLLPSSTD